MKAHGAQCGIWQDGNSVELLINGEDFFSEVFRCIRAARKEVLLETFIIFEDRIGEGLQQAVIEAASRGVRVVITVDDYGTSDLSSAFVAQMIASCNPVALMLVSRRSRYGFVSWKCSGSVDVSPASCSCHSPSKSIRSRSVALIRKWCAHFGHTFRLAVRSL